MKITLFNHENQPSSNEKSNLVDFLFTQLENFGDAREHIEKAVDFSLKIGPSFGGFVLRAEEDSKIVCVVVVNKTGMQGYIPENILVYIATHKEMRGKGVGKQLMKYAMESAEGSIALHVEPDNPARYLYEKLGFTNKYLEMRFAKQV